MQKETGLGRQTSPSAEELLVAKSDLAKGMQFSLQTQLWIIGADGEKGAVVHRPLSPLQASSSGSPGLSPPGLSPPLSAARVTYLFYFIYLFIF